MSKKQCNPFISFDKKEHKYYNEILIKADTNLHDQIAEYISTLDINKNQKDIKILDYGCGEGALSQRLFDLGYDVISVDINSESFKAETKFVHLDFNNKEAVKEFIKKHNNFDIILGVEVIEHIFSPYDYLNNIKQMMNSKTIAIITTPNISSWWNRVYFFLTGRLFGFEEHDWSTQGHIHPFTEAEMKILFKELNLLLIEKICGGEMPVIWVYNLKRLILSLLLLPFRIIMKGDKDSWITLYVIKKNND